VHKMYIVFDEAYVKTLDQLERRGPYEFCREGIFDQLPGGGH
jgi:hypothetical protein